MYAFLFKRKQILNDDIDDDEIDRFKLCEGMTMNKILLFEIKEEVCVSWSSRCL